MYLDSYLSTHGISGLAACGDCERLYVRLKMTIERMSTSITHVSPYTRRRSLMMYLKAMIEQVWRCTGGLDRANLKMHLDAEM